jgi:hypothetical protein
MKKATRHLLGGIALTAGALGAIGAVLMRNNTGSRRQRRREKSKVADMWARPGMTVVFRAELMPGREASERTFRIDSLLPSGRVLLEGVTGEHAQREFEPIR